MNKNELKSKMWYRFLKVFYIGFSILILALGYEFASGEGWRFWFVWIFWQCIIEFIIYKSFLYIVTGKLK